MSTIKEDNFPELDDRLKTLLKIAEGKQVQDDELDALCVSINEAQQRLGMMETLTSEGLAVKVELLKYKLDRDTQPDLLLSRPKDADQRH